MKKIFNITLSVFVLSFLFSCAPSKQVTAESKAAELQQKEQLRRAKEEKKEAKEFAKIEKKNKKEEKKLAKLQKLQKKYDCFMCDYKPLGACTSIKCVNDYFCSCDKIFVEMAHVNENIGFIEVKTRTYTDEDGIEITEMSASNKNTGAFIKKSDALKTYTKSGIILADCLLKATNLATNSTKVLASLTKDPLKAFSIRKKLMKSVKALKMSVQVIPLIQRKIKNNTEALQQIKNN